MSNSDSDIDPLKELAKPTKIPSDSLLLEVPPSKGAKSSFNKSRHNIVI